MVAIVIHWSPKTLEMTWCQLLCHTFIRLGYNVVIFISFGLLHGVGQALFQLPDSAVNHCKSEIKNCGWSLLCHADNFLHYIRKVQKARIPLLHENIHFVFSKVVSSDVKYYHVWAIKAKACKNLWGRCKLKQEYFWKWVNIMMKTTSKVYKRVCTECDEGFIMFLLILLHTHGSPVYSILNSHLQTNHLPM